MQYEFTAKLWRYSGDAAWYFITLPKDYSEEIKILTKDITRGFKSVRVKIRIGGSEWGTSIFPDSKTNCYLLPIKKSVRQVEQIDDGDQVTVELQIKDI